MSLQYDEQEFLNAAHRISLLDLELTSSFRVFNTMQEHIHIYTVEAELRDRTDEFKATFADTLNAAPPYLLKKLEFFLFLDKFVGKVFRGVSTSYAMGVFGYIDYMIDLRDYFKVHKRLKLGQTLPSAILQKLKRLDTLMVYHAEGPAIPLTKANASEFSIRISSPYAQYLLDLIDHYAFNWDLTRTYQKVPDRYKRAPGEGEWSWLPLDVTGCPGGGAFFSNPLAICDQCHSMLAAKPKRKIDAAVVEKFAIGRRRRLRLLDIRLAKGREVSSNRHHFDNSGSRLLVSRARNSDGSYSSGEDGAHSHIHWRLRRVPPVIPIKPTKRLAANVCHTLHFVLRDLKYRRTNDKDENQSSFTETIRDRHCYNYSVRDVLPNMKDVCIVDGGFSVLNCLVNSDLGSISAAI